MFRVRLVGVVVFVLCFLVVLVLLVKEGKSQSNMRSKVDYLRAQEFVKEGVYYFNQRQYTAASNAFMKGLLIDSNYHKARYWLGKSYYQSGNVKNAIEEWEYILNFVGWEPLIRNKIGRFLYNVVGGESHEDWIEDKYVVGVGLGGGGLRNPSSIYIDDMGYWVANYGGNNILMLDRNGVQVMEIEGWEGDFAGPYDVIKNEEGEIYVSDFGNDRVHKYNKGGEYMRSIGGSGVNEGDFYGPQGLDLDDFGNLYVVDRGNNRVQKFNGGGDFLMDFGVGVLSEPTDVLVRGGRIYVSDTGNGKVQIYDLSGNWLRSLGGGILRKPRGLKEGLGGVILVADSEVGFYILDEEHFLLKKKKNMDIEDMGGLVDLGVDKNGFLYMVGLDRGEISTYVPEKMKYSHLEVNMMQTYAPGYQEGFFSQLFNGVMRIFGRGSEKKQKITHRVLVRDQYGQGLYGLDEGNFEVYEGGGLRDVKVALEGGLRGSLSLVIVNEASREMRKHRRKVEEAMRGILKSLGAGDRVQVINFDRDYWIGQGYISSELSPLRVILDGVDWGMEGGGMDGEDGEDSEDSEDRGSEDRGKKLGEGLYRGVESAYSDLKYQGVVLVLTSEELGEDIFEPYGYEVCLYHAKNNQVPVYVIGFNEGGKGFHQELKNIAKMSGGDYLNGYRLGNMGELVGKMRSYQESVYVVQYDSIVRGRSRSLNDWRSVKMKVMFNGLFGLDTGGYFNY